MKRLLIVANQPVDSMRQIVAALEKGARHPDVDSVTVQSCLPLQAEADDVLQADGIILGTTENFGYMSGQIKDFFERIYYPCLEETEGLPCALVIKAGQDGQGALHSTRRILQGLGWKEVHEPTVCVGNLTPSFIQACEETGLTLAAGLEAGIY